MRSSAWRVRLSVTLLLCACGVGVVPVVAMEEGKNAGEAQTQRERLQLALKQGVTFMINEQLPHGEFPVWWFVTQQQKWELDSTPFGTAVILYSLRFVEDPRVVEIRHKAADFLLAEMEPQGLWRYWSTRNKRHDQIVPDVADTVLVGLSLLTNSVSFERDLAVLLRNRNQEGLFWSFLRPANEKPNQEALKQDPLMGVLLEHYVDESPDAVVNANALAYLARQGQSLPEVCAYLVRVAGEGSAVASRSTYYPSPYAFSYALAQAYREGATCLQPATDVVRAWVMEGQKTDGSWGNALETALALNTLLMLEYSGPELEEGMGVLLSQQQDDGSWPREKFWGSAKDVQKAFGSPGVTTGFVMEAIGRYLAHRPRET